MIIQQQVRVRQAQQEKEIQVPRLPSVNRETFLFLFRIPMKRRT